MALMLRRAAAPAARAFAPSMSAITIRALSAKVVQTFLDREEVAERVMRVVKAYEKVDDAKVTETAHFNKDLGLDSLDTVEVCMSIEDEFTIQIPDAEAEKILSIEDAIEFVATHPQAK